MNTHGPFVEFVQTSARRYPACSLARHHEDRLAHVGILREVAEARGYRTVTEKTVLARNHFADYQRRVPGILVPVFPPVSSSDGATFEFAQFRPDSPRAGRRGRPVKYETPADGRNVLDCLPTMRGFLADPKMALVVTEGVFKADAVTSAALREAAGGPPLAVCLSLQGVYGYRGRNALGGLTALADWEAIALNGRRVLLAFDSDAMTKQEVYKALGRLKRFLEAKGAVVEVVYLPDGPRGEKQGADDYLAAGHSLADLLGLAEPELREPPDPTEVQRSAPPLGSAGVDLNVSLDQHGANRTVSARTVLASREPFSWPDPVDGTHLIEMLAAVFARYAVLPAGAAVALALWTAATWLVDLFDAFPYLAITSPQKRCGKTRVMELLMLVVKRALPLAGISEAALFRVIESERPTLLIDEAQHLRTRDERSAALHDLLCAGMRRPTAYVCRVGGAHRDELQRFSVFCPKAIALIGEMTDVLTDRAIEISMRRRKRAEHVTRFFFAQASAEIEPVRQQIARWTADHHDGVRKAYLETTLPDWLEDREAELWAPLLAVAHVAIPERIADVEKIVRKMSGAKAEMDDSIGVRLLADVRAALDGRDFVPTKDIIASLVAVEDAPWSEYRAGKSITAKGLADLLKPFGIEPDKARHDGQAGIRGYFRQAFQDAWERYLPANPRPDPPQAPQSLRDNGQSEIPDVPQPPTVADAEMSGNASRTRAVARVASSTSTSREQTDLQDLATADVAGAQKHLRHLAALWEWPEIYIGFGHAVPAGPEAWSRFLAQAPREQVAWAIADLESLETGAH